jgi:hypothetical protein
MPGRINGFSLAYGAIGGVVLWSGITGTKLSATFRGLLQGQGPKVNQEPINSSTANQEPATPAGTTGAAAQAAPAANTGADSQEAADNQAIAKLLAHPYGWSAGTQWADLVSLWNQESGWSTTAVNSSTGATGIPQLNPEAHAIPPDWSSPVVQITWGLSYIKTTYGTPSVAWAHEVTDGWY